MINVRVEVESFPAFGKSATDLRISTVSHFSYREIAVQFTPAIKTAPVSTLQSKLTKATKKINVILSLIRNACLDNFMYFVHGMTL